MLLNNTVNYLTPKQHALLREQNVITDKEVALIVGDLVIAQHIELGTKRVLGTSTVILNESTSSKTVLKG